jgi:protein-disulfide isomerase
MNLPRAAALGLLLAVAATAPFSARAAAAAEDLPGVDLSALTPAQADVVRRVATDEFCHCGCPHTLAGCLREHKACKHAPRMASLVVRLAGQGLGIGEVLKALTAYYSGFDPGRRAKLDVSGFGPPLGRADAKVTLVEFSDFACPFCQALRPELERFVREHEGRVKLFYKPFPIASHPRSLEAALAGEWARAHGVFWPMHDRLFSHPHELSDDDLAADARALGADPDDLLAALADGRDRTRVAASQAEARAGGLVGTPTLFLNGRRIELGPVRDAIPMLQFALEDEEEWLRAGRFDRD